MATNKPVVNYRDPQTGQFTGLPACFDAEYGMQHSLSAVNARSAETARVCTDQIHPAENGYKQIADIILAALLTQI